MRQRNRLADRLAALSAVLLTAVCAFPTAALDVEPADCYWYTGQGRLWVFLTPMNWHRRRSCRR